jgi:hypothetical protein
LGTVNAPGYGTYWINRLGDSWQTASYYYLNPGITIDKYGNSYLAWQQGVTPGQSGSSGDIEAYLYVRKLNNKGEELWTKRYASVPILYPTQRVIPTLDTNSQYLYLAWGARFRETDPGQPFSLQPSCELFKINPSNGDVIWYHYYIFAGPGSTYYIDSFTRLQYDSYLNKLVIFYRNYWLAQSFYVDPETPSSITPGSQFYEGSTSESLRTIEDAMVIRSEEDPTKTFVITVDKGNRYIWWETDEYFRSTTGASGLRYGFGTTFTYNNPPRAVPTPVTFSGQEHYISANGELGTARLVVWNQNREPVLRTSTDLGVAVGIAKDTEDPSSVYICFTTGTTTGTPSISGITYKGKSTMSIAKYTPQTNEIKTYSMLTVVSGHLLDINGASNRATMFDGHEGINNNINNVNRAVFTFYNDNTDAVAIASGVNSLFVIGASIMASGTTKYFDWGNTAGYSGVVEATDQISQNLGSTSLPSLATPFSNIGSQYNSPYENGSETVTVVDLTGNITTAYGYTSLD